MSKLLRASLLFAAAAILLTWTAAAFALPVHNVTQSTDYADLASAMTAANAGDMITVDAGTYALGATVAMNKANVTVQGAGAGSTVYQISSGVGFAFVISGNGFTLKSLTLEKTDLANQNLIQIVASNVTVQDCEIFGPDPGTDWSTAGVVSRALEISGGLSGLTISGNDIHTVRQPAYINPGTTGNIINNHTSGTKGWVIDGAVMSFSGNTWGPPANQSSDIALLASCSPLDYPDLVTLSAGNDDARVDAQFVGGEIGRAVAYVDAAASPGGTAAHPFPTKASRRGSPAPSRTAAP